MNAPAKSLSDLSFDRMIRLNAERDRNTQLMFGVYNGKASLAVFSGQGGPPKVKFGLPKFYPVIFREYFTLVAKRGPESKESIPIQKWDPEQKKFLVVGSITLGFDNANQPYIGITAQGIEPTKFPLRHDLAWDIGTTQGVDVHKITVEGFLQEISNLQQAQNLTQFRFDPSQVRGGGGNRGGYSGGGGGRPSGGSSAGDVLSDEIPF